MKKVLVIMLVLLVGMGLVMAAGSSESAKKTYDLKISTSQTEQSLMYKAYDTFAKRVNEKSDGRLNVSVFASSQLGNDEDVIEQAIQGAGIAVNTDAARMGTYVNEMGILMMGFFADDYDECLKVTQTPQFARWEDELAEKHKIRVLAFDFYDGPRHFLTNKPINSPADLKGLTIRTIGAPVCIASIGAMGATPIAMAWGEVYNGIQTKAIDGAEAQSTSTYPSKIYEVVSYLTKTSHFQLLQGLICGEKWYQGLPADLQALLKSTAREVGAESAKWVIEEADKSEALMVKAGLTIVKPDLAPFKKAVEPAYVKMGYLDLRNEIYKAIGKVQ
ncbi:C4-dicarboxylate TRAP transporter substrate-binding protein [Sphaerochaeta sp. PS]|uniref:C4-dicarboxylate TRAP transporter substrate-binding protein n=1 Tax=Sphaerochaeta sp. PS TaxID=3076336 RepID=UPI0028A351B4|nr:C4-dicarboxylate TRAP transporter substrate-binding protein [Sphaerochaeta sp. PS]MDT4762215.1 C4-dicarboxylate TRAP transporter substrate-binding protein [Sphaerochaeta sp. PS]